MSTPTNDGGSAFPFVCQDISKHQAHEAGMSLRDWFAGQALAGDFAAQGRVTGEWLNEIKNGVLQERSRFFYRFADAMLAAREGGSE